MAKAIDLERFARLTAEIEHGVPAPVLLSREGIAEGTWAEAQEEWLSTLAGETAERESTDLNTRYQRAYGERLAALEGVCAHIHLGWWSTEWSVQWFRMLGRWS